MVRKLDKLDPRDTSLRTMEDVELLETKRKYDGFFKLDQQRLRHRKFSGDWSQEIIREVVRRKDAVATLIYDPDLDAVCLLQQFRSATIGLTPSPWVYEFVAGLVDKEGESLEEVARREAYEESGVEPLYLEKINSYWVSVGGSNERMTLFLALASLEDAGGIFGVEEESEDILALVVSREDAENWAFNTEQANATCIIGLQWLKNERHRLSLMWQNYRTN